VADAYTVVSQSSGGAVVVDTSKEAADAALIATIPNVSTSLVHIVRDPRGVVHSHLRAEPPAHTRLGAVAYLAVSWVITNAAAALARAVHGRHGRSVLVRYEALVESPERELSRIAACAVQPQPSSPLRRQGDEIWLEPCHTADGNPSRMQNGNVALREDTSWETGLSNVERFVIAVITWPVRQLLGY
jgi:hypothetical protein